MSGDDSEVLLTELLKISQKELDCINETCRFTKEMAEAFSRNDQKSARMLMGMRGASLGELEKLRLQRKMLLEAAGDARERMETLLRGQSVPDKNDREERLRRLSESFKSSLEKTCALDRQVSRRVAQDKSFYSG